MATVLAHYCTRDAAFLFKVMLHFHTRFWPHTGAFTFLTARLGVATTPQQNTTTMLQQ